MSVGTYNWAVYHIKGQQEGHMTGIITELKIVALSKQAVNSNWRARNYGKLCDSEGL